MNDDMLFPMPDPPAKRMGPVSVDRQRTERQKAAIRRGMHPLGSRLHPQANRYATKDDPRNEPFTCGTCAHRIQINHGTARDYPKCELVNTASAASDCRAWWPACVSFVPKEEQ